MQWSDSTSLNVLKHIICGLGTVFFIGSYRSNEVDQEAHPIFQFMDELKGCINVTEVQLDSLSGNEVNSIISDALGILPRLCKPLSDLVLLKTEGNALFVLECLKSLVTRRLLQYSCRERRWIYDIDKIRADEIADNVCELFTKKMADLPGSRVLGKNERAYGTVQVACLYT